MRGKPILPVLLAVSFALGTWASVALGDGGSVRFSERRSDYRITVFTSPTPLRAGLVDVSVLVQDVNSGTLVTDVEIVVRARSIHGAQRRMSAPATTEAATNKLMRAASLEFSEPGWWHVEVAVQGTGEELPIGFDVDVAEALPPWLEMSLWIGCPVVAISFFAIHQGLVRLRQHSMIPLGESAETPESRHRGR